MRRDLDQRAGLLKAALEGLASGGGAGDRQSATKR
jgi:hypothetical protein